MIFSKVKTSTNAVLDFTNSKQYCLYDIDGLAPVAATINTTEFATSDGALFNSARIGTRNIVLYIKLLPEIEKNRLMLYQFFRIKSNVTLYFRHDSLDVSISGKVESFELDHFSNSQVAQISILCPNPYFRSAENQIVEFSNTIALFEFPFTNPPPGLEFSRIEKVTTKIINAGGIPTGITIRLTANTGDIVNPVIYNLTNNTFFGLNVEMQKGDVITITTHFNGKKITLLRDGVETNILYDMQDGSTWLQLESGENEISYSCESGESNLTVSVEYTEQYEGI